MGVEAIDDGGGFACQYAMVPQSDKIYLFNRYGNVSGTKEFESGQALTEFLNSISDALLQYNGQTAFFEPYDGDYSDVSDWTIIP